ncbi:MAG TPA: hypothetical protein VKJ01_10185, partial [Candidatus Solibacter sp.]|nr:hypothetical protein [Candidatus Solibacter sp.]
HIFANTQKHGTVGVSKESYTVQDLMSGDFVFEEREDRALRTGKAHDALANTASAGNTAGVM